MEVFFRANSANPITKEQLRRFEGSPLFLSLFLTCSQKKKLDDWRVAEEKRYA